MKTLKAAVRKGEESAYQHLVFTTKRALVISGELAAVMATGAWQAVRNRKNAARTYMFLDQVGK